LFVWVWLLLAGTCFARQVYLKDGGIVEAQSVRRQGGLIVVQVNRDTVVEFERSEVDLRRTFRPAINKKHSVGKKKPAASQRSLPAVKAKTADAAGTSAAPGASLPAAPAVAKPATPAAKPAATPAAKPGPSNAPAVQPQPAPAPVVQPQPVSAPAPVAAPPAKVEAPPEPAARPSAEPAPSMTKEELEKVRKEAAEMMAEAIRKKDPEMMKKAVELQKSTMPQSKTPDMAAAKGMSVTVLLLILVVSLLIVVSMWVVFEKCGQDGWKSLIPIYNMYVLMVICEKPVWWFLLLFIPMVGTVFYLLAMLALSERFGRGPLFGIGLTFLPMIFFPLLAFGGSKPEEFSFS
jgi:hypothetical protein